jgi:hypothetical protein
MPPKPESPTSDPDPPHLRNDPSPPTPRDKSPAPARPVPGAVSMRGNFRIFSASPRLRLRLEARALGAGRRQLRHQPWRGGVCGLLLRPPRTCSRITWIGSLSSQLPRASPNQPGHGRTSIEPGVDRANRVAQWPSDRWLLLSFGRV